MLKLLGTTMRIRDHLIWWLQRAAAATRSWGVECCWPTTFSQADNLNNFAKKSDGWASPLPLLLLLLLPYGCSAAKEASQKNLSSKSNAKQPTLFIICIFGSLHIRLQSYFPIELPFLLLSVMSFIVRAHHSQEEEATWWPHPPHHNSSMYLGNF